MKTTKNTKTMQSITANITESMKQSFVETSKTMSKDEILSHLSSFANRKVKKAWLTKRINDRVVYLNLVKQASTEGWKHFYGQPIHQKFVELQMATLQSMIEVRLRLSPEAERESLLETFLGGLVNSQPKVVQKPQVKVQPKVVKAVPQPKVATVVKTTKPQPKVVEQDQMTKVIELLGEVTKQVTTCLDKLVEHSNAIAELQKVVSQPKVAKAQPKVVKAEPTKVQPKVAKAVPQPKVAKAQPKVVKTEPTTPKGVKAKKQPKVGPLVSLIEAFWKTATPKQDKKSKISHEDAFNHRSDVEKGTYKKFRMEVY